MKAREYVITKTFQNIGLRYLRTDQEPYTWVSDLREACRVQHPYPLDENSGGEAVEVDAW